MSKVYMIYDTKSDDVSIAQFDNLNQVAEYFEMTVNTVSSGISKSHLFKWRYRIERVDIE